MTDRAWNGGVARFLDPDAWTPFGVPSPGDALTIDTGTSIAKNLTITDESIFFRHSESSTDPVPELAIKGVTISADSKIYTDNIRIVFPVIPPVEFLPGDQGRIEASGHNVNFGTIAAQSGDLISPAGSRLDVDLKAGLFVNEGILQNDVRSGLFVASTEGAVLKNDGTILANGGGMVVDAPVIGDGVILLDPEPLGFLHGGPIVGNVELGSSVGPNQTIDILQGGSLTIDDVAKFHADIKDFSHLDFNGLLLEAIVLKGVDVTSFSYRSAGGSGVLTLKSGGDVVGRLSFLGDYTAASFHTSSANGSTTLTV